MPPNPQHDKQSTATLYKLATVYTIGFVFVNAGYVVVNVSLAETLRSAEPLSSLVLAVFFLKEEPVTMWMVLSLVPIVVGGALSSSGDSSFSPIALLFVFISNTSFSLRSVFAKHLKRGYKGDAIVVFYEISRLGLFGLACLALLGTSFLFLHSVKK